MKLSCKFKKQCRTSEKRFRNYLALKEAGNDEDFCTFLKNNDESLMFRFPPLCGNSTPTLQKRDDDNESTCTSIRNFMTDILQADEIPDSEARIIREVIEEEADILDDSLDSHWMQDDVSIDTDFRLDFSLSPFSTPRSVNNDRCFTPLKLKEQMADRQLQYETAKEILRQPVKVKEEPATVEEPDDTSVDITEFIEGQIHADESVAPPKLSNFYVENEELNNDKVISVVDVDTQECSIDRNLEEALKQSNTEYALDDLIATPRIYAGASGSSTPTIKNILFGEKLDDDNNTSNIPKVGQCIEKFENIEGDIDILEDFFKKDATELENNKLDEPFAIEEQNIKKVEDIESKYDMTNFICKMCDKQYKSAKALKIHLTKYHKMEPQRKKSYYYSDCMCDHCGKSFNSKTNLSRHIKWHMGMITRPKLLKCKHCAQEYSSSKMRMHMTTHIGKAALKPRVDKYICTTCGATSTSKSNFKIHLLRHSKEYKMRCEECNRGFYRKADLMIHYRTHTREKPYACSFCDKSFNRRDTLNNHMKLHTDEKPFKCMYCKTGFNRKGVLKNHLLTSKVCINKRLQSALMEHAEFEQKGITTLISYDSDDNVSVKNEPEDEQSEPDDPMSPLQNEETEEFDLQTLVDDELNALQSCNTADNDYLVI